MKPMMLLWLIVLSLGILLLVNAVGIFYPANQFSLDNVVGIALIVLSGYRLTHMGRR